VSQKDEAYRRSLRYLFAHTEEVACDAQGRVVVPSLLRAFSTTPPPAGGDAGRR